MFKSDVRSVPIGILMKIDVDDKNRCRLVCVKFLLNRCRFAAAVAKCLGRLTFLGHSVGLLVLSEFWIRVYVYSIAGRLFTLELAKYENWISVQFSSVYVLFAPPSSRSVH